MTAGGQRLGRAGGGLQVAIVGCGRAGAQHAEAVAAGGGSVAAVCDDDRRRAAELAARARAPARGLAELLADPTVDAVAVCTPPDSHLPLGLEALAAGKAAVIEKPPALSRAGLRRLEAAAAERGLPLAAMLQHRARLPAAALARPWSAAASGVVEVFRHRPPDHYAGTGWRGDRRQAGGGFFAHLAIHYADLACQLLGEPECLQAFVEGSRPGIDLRAAVSARMAGGALLSLHASSLPRARRERLALVDGDRSLTVTSRDSRYVEAGHESVVAAPATAELRAEVYREVTVSLTTRRPLQRFALGAAAGAVAILEQVAAAVPSPAPAVS